MVASLSKLLLDVTLALAFLLLEHSAAMLRTTNQRLMRDVLVSPPAWHGSVLVVLLASTRDRAHTAAWTVGTHLSHVRRVAGCLSHVA